MIKNLIRKLCVVQKQFYQTRHLCKELGQFPTTNSSKVLAELQIPANDSKRRSAEEYYKACTGPMNYRMKKLSSTHPRMHRSAQFFRKIQETSTKSTQSVKKLSRSSMSKRKPKPEVNKLSRLIVDEVINIPSSSEDTPRRIRIAPEASPRPKKSKSARKVTLVPKKSPGPSMRSTRAKAKRKPKSPPPATSDSETDSPAVTPRRKITLGDVRPNSVLSDRIVGIRSERPSRSRSPRVERRSPQPTTSDGRVARRPGRTPRHLSRHRSPSTPRRRTHWHSSPQRWSSSGSPRDRTPLGLLLDYEFRDPETTVSQADENSLDRNIEGLDDDLPKDHPLRVAINATGLSTEDPPDLRYCIRNVGTKSRNLKRQMTAQLNGISDVEQPIEAADSERKYKTQDWMPNWQSIMKKLFITRWQAPPSVVRIPLIEGPLPSEDYYAQFGRECNGIEPLPGFAVQLFERVFGRPKENEGEMDILMCNHPSGTTPAFGFATAPS